ncbi:MAG: hypothetical protein KF772_04385 [Cryobacterium sp.]|nr:hypothetical protein [Cryobacterium sp.]MCO5295072.1 hypothetical protein [Homoserinimonas sp.]
MLTDKDRDEVMPPRHDGGLVWHYANAEALKGILEAHAIWASCVQSLNDDQEILFGIDLIRGSVRDASKDAQRWVGGMSEELAAQVLADSFVVSASIDGDSEHLRDSYGAYVLGFDAATELTKQPATSNLAATTAWQDPRFASGWRRVIYGIPDGLVHASKVVAALEELARDNTCANAEAIAKAAYELIVRGAAYLKSEPWRVEQEVRLFGRASLSETPVSMRVRGDEFVRFLQVTSSTTGSGPLPLRKVRPPRVPVRSYSASAKGVREMLDSAGYQAVQVLA